MESTTPRARRSVALGARHSACASVSAGFGCFLRSSLQGRPRSLGGRDLRLFCPRATRVVPCRRVPRPASPFCLVLRLAFAGRQMASGTSFGQRLGRSRSKQVKWSKCEDLWWNLLDLLCVIIGVADVSTEMLMMTVGMAAFAPLNTITLIRVLRVVRVIRVVRVPRLHDVLRYPNECLPREVIRIMRFFRTGWGCSALFAFDEFTFDARELRMMVFSIVNCLKSVVWIMLILFILFYMFGIIFTSGVVGFLDTLEKRRRPENADLQRNFGSLGRAVLSLYMAMSGGADWGEPESQ